MEIFYKPQALKEYLAQKRQNSNAIGFVPTMGALHRGHLSLLQACKNDHDITVCSIYINPLQFNDKSDLQSYPRDIDKDIELLKKNNCDVLFCPDDRIIYPESPLVKFDFGYLDTIMEGKHRPGHFSGVATIVSKLFNIVKPDAAYFGQKDLQQFIILRQLVKDLSFGIKLVCCPVVRENDGLAISSRNIGLSNEARKIAPNIYKALVLGKNSLVRIGNQSELKEKLQINNIIKDTKKKVKEFIFQFRGIELEYFEIVDSETLKTVKDIKNHNKIALCIAAQIGSVRLIDNLIIE
ncbi:MAG: pantoate--beta-alanine ligase [Bacteroidetes bacterium]|nr:pantoate--beta-alanine ligase [Bacteroidota bacterium]